jgi:2-(1,2-epoxy-1,2-dihydrophenyl)acetyl-CoA isomerase
MLLVERANQIATITLNRPDSLNALTRAGTEELHEILDTLEGEFPEIRAIIITATGRGFCVGADMKDLAKSATRGPTAPSETPRRHIGHLGPHVRHMPQPVICAVNGIAVGAGFALVLGCDLRIAAEEARFAGIFIDRSLPPDGASSTTLATIIGPTAAAELLFTGRIYDSAWAERVGLVNSVVPADELMPSAVALAEEIASKPPLAMRLTKDLMRRHDPDLLEIVEWEMDALRQLNPTADYREAITSFVEKRQPVFYGR